MPAIHAHPGILCIEPNLRTPSGHYAEFVRALGIGAGAQGVEVFAHPAADRFLQAMQGVRIASAAPRADEPLAEWRIIDRCIRDERVFLVLTADGRHTALASLLSGFSRRSLQSARFYFHNMPTGVKAALLRFSGPAKRQALAIAPTAAIADALRALGWRWVQYHPYPALGPERPPGPADFRHLLMAGSARVNKGLDLIAPLLASWTAQGRRIPLLIQVSRKHVHRHGSREAQLVDAVLGSGYPALRAEGGAPDRAEYCERFGGALVLAPYEQRRFADAVSGVVLDALLHGAPVIATHGTWPGAQVERFAAGVTLETRTPQTLSDAVDRILADWPAYCARACEAAVVLAREHDPAGLFRLLVQSQASSSRLTKA
jgi:hypothetical protein